MDIISCIFIIIIVLFVILGLVRGFLRSLLSSAKGLISFVLALLLCSPVASLFSNASFVISGENAINNWLCSTSELFAVRMVPGHKDELLVALKTLSIPDFLASFLADRIDTQIPPEGIELGVTVANSLMNIVLMVASFIILVIVIRLLLLILRKFTKGLVDRLPTIKVIDRVFGVIFGLFMSIIVIDVICIIFTGIMSAPFLTDFANVLKNQMALENPDAFTLSKYFYENNLILKIVSNFF